LERKTQKTLCENPSGPRYAKAKQWQIAAAYRACSGKVPLAIGFLSDVALAFMCKQKTYSVSSSGTRIALQAVKRHEIIWRRLPEIGAPSSFGLMKLHRATKLNDNQWGSDKI
jgi:hypothetical protein